MDEDPLVYYDGMGVFMHLLGVACDTSPALLEKGPHLLSTLPFLLCVDSLAAVLLLLGQCVSSCDTVLRLHAPLCLVMRVDPFDTAPPPRS